jgi:nucleotide-binding universal stress UspA family protein
MELPRKKSKAVNMITIGNILVPVDLSQAAVIAARYAANLAQTHRADLYVLHVKAPYPVHGRVAAGALEHVQKHRIRKEGIELSELIPADIKNSIAVTEIQVTGTPIARVIVEKARHLEVDVIVMAAQPHSGWQRFFRENVLQRVIRDAPCSVFAVRCPQDEALPQNIAPMRS